MEKERRKEFPASLYFYVIIFITEMVRIYCLSSIKKINSNEFPTTITPNSTDMSYFQDETYPSTLNKIPESASFFQLTEICIGYKFKTETIINFLGRTEKKTLIYAINIYRKDTEMLTFNMTKGTVIFNPISTYTFDLVIKTSLKFPDEIDFDLLIKVRCIKNTIIKGILNEEEEKYYEDYAERLKNCAREPDFSNFALPKTTKLNALRTKISDIRNLISLLCDPINGDYSNIPIEKRYDQELKCLMDLRKKWKTKNFRKDEFDQQINTYSGSSILCWEKVNFGKLSQKIRNIRNITEIDFESVKIINAEQKFYDNFKRLNFAALTKLTLILCNLKEFSDEFIDLLPATLIQICLEHNDITFVSKGISKFENLEHLYLSNNRNLDDDGFPWDSLPSGIQWLGLTKTKITKIPSSIQRLESLYLLSIGNHIQSISWKSLNPCIHALWIFKGNNLNEVDLSEKNKLEDIQIINAGLNEINCYKLPWNITLLDLSLNKLTNFDTKNMLPNLMKLRLRKNCLKTICWENLPESLQKLTLDGNQIEDIGDLSHLPNLHELNLNSNKIISVPNNFTNLAWLYLSNNFISQLPVGFENLQTIEYLHLDNNKFDNSKQNLEECLWKRLPKKLSQLKLSGNNLFKLPCSMKNLNITYLMVDDCKLFHICPSIYDECRKQKFNQNLVITKNPNLLSLPFIPYTIYQPPISSCQEKDVLIEQTLKVITDKNDFIVTSKFKTHLNKPVYNFQPFEASLDKSGVEIDQDDDKKCQCCANCGKRTDEKIIEQMMMPDYVLTIEKASDKNERNSNNFLDSDTDDIKLQRTVGNSSLIIEAIYGSKRHKIKNYLPGEWKTFVITRLCKECVTIIKQKTDDAFEMYKKNLSEDSTSFKKTKASRNKKQPQIFNPEIMVEEDSQFKPNQQENTTFHQPIFQPSYQFSESNFTFQQPSQTVTLENQNFYNNNQQTNPYISTNQSNQSSQNLSQQNCTDYNYYHSTPRSLQQLQQFETDYQNQSWNNYFQETGNLSLPPDYSHTGSGTLPSTSHHPILEYSNPLQSEEHQLRYDETHQINMNQTQMLENYNSRNLSNQHDIRNPVS